MCQIHQSARGPLQKCKKRKQFKKKWRAKPKKICYSKTKINEIIGTKNKSTPDLEAQDAFARGKTKRTAQNMSWATGWKGKQGPARP